MQTNTSNTTSNTNAANSANTSNGKVFTYKPGQATAQALFAWVNNGPAKGNRNAVYIVPNKNVNPSAATPIPFGMGRVGGNRHTIFMALVNGVPVQGGKPVRTLQAYLGYSGKYGASQSNPLDLLAALNGGFSRSSKAYGTAYVTVTTVAPSGTGNGASKPAKAASKPAKASQPAATPAAPAAPASQPAATPAAPAAPANGNGQ